MNRINRPDPGNLVSAGTLAVVLLLTYQLFGVQWQSAAVVVGLWAASAAALDLLFGYAGQVSLAQGGFVAIGAYSSAIVTVKLGWSPYLGIVVGLAVAAVLAGVLARSVLRLGELYLALVTLAFALAVPALIGVLHDWTGGFSGLYGIPPLTIGGYTLMAQGTFYILAWGLAFLVAWSVRRIVRSRTGLAARVLAQSPDAARVVGVDVTAIKRHFFIASALPAALAGSIFAHYSNAVTPDPFTLVLLSQILTYVIVGGRATGWGALFGGVLVGALILYAGFAGSVTDVIYGVLLVAVLFFAPRGLTGLVEIVRDRLRPAAPRGEPDTDVDQAEIVGLVERLAELDGRSGAGAAAGETLLSTDAVARHFGGVHALRGVSLEVRAGEIHCIIGPNGSGKSTWLNVAGGLITPDTGGVQLLGRDVTALPTHRRARLGLGRTLQTPTIISELSVVDNVAVGGYRLGRRGMVGSWLTGLGAAELADMRDRAHTVLEGMGLAHLEGTAPDSLGSGYRRLVELARALVSGPSVLLLDEPFAGMTSTERVKISGLLIGLARGGMAICVVEHDMETVERIADRVTVLDGGLVAVSGETSQVLGSEDFRRAYTGSAEPAESVGNQKGA